MYIIIKGLVYKWNCDIVPNHSHCWDAEPYATFVCSSSSSTFSLGCRSPCGELDFSTTKGPANCTVFCFRQQCPQRNPIKKNTIEVAIKTATEATHYLLVLIQAISTCENKYHIKVIIICNYHIQLSSILPDDLSQISWEFGSQLPSAVHTTVTFLCLHIGWCCVLWSTVQYVCVTSAPSVILV